MENTKTRELLTTNLPGVYVAPSVSKPGSAHVIVVREGDGRLAGIECGCPGAVHQGRCWHKRAAYEAWLAANGPEFASVYEGPDRLPGKRWNALYG